MQGYPRLFDRETSAITIQDNVTINSNLSCNTIDTNTLISNDSSAINVADNMNVQGLLTAQTMVVEDDVIRVRTSWDDDSTRSASTGKAGDVAGMIAWGDDYVYVCTGTFDGSTAIWKRAALSTF